MADDWEAKLNQKVGERIFESIGDIASTVQRIMDDAEKKFATMLVLKGIDVGHAPSFGRYSTKWKPLDPGWLRRKLKKGHSENFYSYEGDLARDIKTTLGGLNARTVLGRPLIQLVTRSGTLTMKGGRGSTPAAIGLSALKKRQFSDISIRVRMYPNIENDLKDPRSGKLEEEVFGHDDNLIGAKLTNWKGDVDRPLLSPYMKWFSRIFVANKIKELIR